METLGDILGAKKGHSKYVCVNCDFKCGKKYSWNRHLTTNKHIQVTEKVQKGAKINENTPYCCENCGKEYTSRNGLWKHNKICKKIEENNSIHNNNNINFDKDLIMLLINQNKELLEIVKNGVSL